MTVLMYAAETWTLKKRGMNRLRAFEIKCLRMLLNVKWQQKIKNTDIMKRTGTTHKHQYIAENYREVELRSHMQDAR